jgi:hypothetical protein
MENYIVINEDIKDNYIIWKNLLYVRTFDAYGVIYVPISKSNDWNACILNMQDIAYDSMV